MKISMAAMVDEVALIKLGEDYQPMNRAEVKQMLKNVAVSGLGMGVGTGIGHVINRTIGPKIFKRRPQLRKGVLMAGGALSGLLAAEIMNRNLALMRKAREEDARKRNT